jgi:hypothetical protein
LQRRRIAAVVVCLCAAVGLSSVALAASSAPSKVTVSESQTFKFKPNRYIQDGLRWKKDVYTIKSGGTLHVVNNEAGEGPHTFTAVKESDLPKTAQQINTCAICGKLGKAHGADPNSDAPPKFQFLENGVGQDTAPSFDRAGDSGVTGSGKKGESIDMKVTAKAGTTLYFMCLIHPWMQGKLVVK